MEVIINDKIVYLPVGFELPPSFMYMVESGVELTANGCGSRGFSLCAADFVQWLFMVDLSPACWVHDVCYDVPDDMKSLENKLRDDMCFHLNVEEICYLSGLSEWKTEFISRVFHTLLILHGDDAYFIGKSKGKHSYNQWLKNKLSRKK